MAGLQVRALYDFAAGTPEELTFNTDEYLTVVNQDVGEGWWEALNSRNQRGLIPKDYVEVVSMPEPSMPPPRFPPPAFPAPSFQTASQSFAAPPGRTSAYVAPAAVSAPSAPPNDDDWDDDDWDDDSIAEGQTGSTTGSSTVQTRDKGQQPAATAQGTVGRKGFSRFSTYAKMGFDAFLLGQNTPTTPPQTEPFKIMEVGGEITWAPYPSPDTCTVASPKKESKFKGIKSYIAYQLTPSSTGIQVSRRYKHFDWLHERLMEKFPTIAIPPLPDKQVTGRYEEDFIASRMRQLQEWVTRMTSHPVVGQSPVWRHFISCTDDKAWKDGKRKAEKDNYLGGKFFLLIATPPAPLDSIKVDGDMDTFARFQKQMDDQVKHMNNLLTDQHHKYTRNFKKEYLKCGDAFTNLAASFELDSRPSAQGLTVAVRETGKAYNDIGAFYEQQPRYDIMPLHDVITEYRGLLSCFPDILGIHKVATVKVKECQKLREEMKMNESDVQSVSSHMDVVSYAVYAEINHFQRNRVRDFKKIMQDFLKQQIEFHKKITARLESALRTYDEA